jgi:two-component system chemotaxis response regulator CheY
MSFSTETHFMIVDDSLFMRSMMKQALTAMGYAHVLEASDGMSARDQLVAGAQVDVILSDNYMPQMTGLELLHFLRSDSKFSKTSFVLCTVDTELKVIMEALDSGAQGYLLKPGVLGVLSQKLESTLRHLAANPLK